ncbi:flagellar hook-length control protein FliK [Edaphosphingomonas haloaromaticamans]|uniref:Flagellar hook-length control protein FliK n=1 Tax=Edaphosphingomonas haloaromaticamans TaxID=653954 RepID=A0A1S1HGH9_9SPHN|nr:flagellar hook-length control protein FliK [Sphingomonas haloaromaticamans]OHT21325.1 Flagellar hook-length control protein FliK [Sphingomonas haloaromaticamans]
MIGAAMPVAAQPAAIAGGRPGGTAPSDMFDALIASVGAITPGAVTAAPVGGAMPVAPAGGDMAPPGEDADAALLEALPMLAPGRGGPAVAVIGGKPVLPPTMLPVGEGVSVDGDGMTQAAVPAPVGIDQPQSVVDAPPPLAVRLAAGRPVTAMPVLRVARDAEAGPESEPDAEGDDDGADAAPVPAAKAEQVAQPAALPIAALAPPAPAASSPAAPPMEAAARPATPRVQPPVAGPDAPEAGPVAQEKVAVPAMAFADLPVPVDAPEAPAAASPAGDVAETPAPALPRDAMAPAARMPPPTLVPSSRPETATDVPAEPPIAAPAAEKRDAVAPSATSPVDSVTPLPPADPRIAPAVSPAPATAAPAAFGLMDGGAVVVARHLDLARDSAWLDQLARDIVAAGDGGTRLQFRLNPEHLGSLHVELTRGDDGASVRLTAETEAARTALADAQGRLVAEARSHGMKIAETHVDLSQQGSGQRQAGDGQPQQQPAWQQRQAQQAEAAPSTARGLPWDRTEGRDAAHERYA